MRRSPERLSHLVYTSRSLQILDGKIALAPADRPAPLALPTDREAVNSSNIEFIIVDCWLLLGGRGVGRGYGFTTRKPSSACQRAGVAYSSLDIGLLGQPFTSHRAFLRFVLIAELAWMFAAVST